MRVLTSLFLACLLTTSLLTQSGYKRPPRDVVDMVDAQPTPRISVAPTRTSLVLVSYSSQPPLELLARPIHRIGGIRIDARRHSRQHLRQYLGFDVLTLPRGKRSHIRLPKDARVSFPVWSPDGKRLAFALYLDDRVELWWADTRTGNATKISGVRLNDVLGQPIAWLSDSRRLLVRTVPEGTGAPPPKPAIPDGPNIDETSGRKAKTWTYQDLIATRHEEDLFAHYARSQILRVDLETGSADKIGEPGYIRSFEISPDGSVILVDKLKEPFSYRVPYYRFSHTSEVWNWNGARLRTIADLPVADNVPTQGVPTGPRSISWQPGHGKRLYWAEALDGGDPRATADFRDAIFSLDGPFKGNPVSLMKTKDRFSGFTWTTRKDEALLYEIDRNRRWVTTSRVSLEDPVESRTVLFNMSWNDVYSDPGDPVLTHRPNGTIVADGDDNTIYLSGRGATPAGYRPFLDAFDLSTALSRRLFACPDDRYDRFISFVGNDRTKIVISSESKTDPPNYVIVDLSSETRTPLTSFEDPAPSMTGMSKQLLHYTREDGTPLSGTLYLPAGYEQGTRLPLLFWAYPREYSDPSTAGQVRASPNSFTFFRGTTPLFFVTQGYAVLMNATMPIIGDVETMNNTFVEQIVSSAKAAIDTLDVMGVIDREKVMVAGHSYGAFMTANVLAHSDLFAAGIARSGAYNRTLTPFGFQSERRTFWEARDTYIKVSPFSWANQINEPLLLIHGEADNNTGTYPIQSQRMFQAIRANGGTARLVMLPYESHGYSGRESVLHVLAEMFEWGERFVKNREDVK